eukprot:5361036-Pleurochrysis_carterae.AAC.3
MGGSARPDGSASQECERSCPLARGCQRAGVQSFTARADAFTQARTGEIQMPVRSAVDARRAVGMRWAACVCVWQRRAAPERGHVRRARFAESRTSAREAKVAKLQNAVLI